MNKIHQELITSDKECEIHGIEKAYYCISENCMLDLCKYCLTFHREVHNEKKKEQIIEKISDVINLSNMKLDKIIQVYENGIKNLDFEKKKREKDWEKMISEIKMKIDEKKEIMENILNAYFQELEQELLKNYIYPTKKLALDSLTIPKKKLHLKIEKLFLLKKNLEKRKNQNEIIKYVLSKNNIYMNNLNNKLYNIINGEIKIKPDSEKINIILEKNKLNNIYLALEEFINVNVNLKELLNNEENSKYEDITSQLDLSNINKSKIEQKNKSLLNNDFNLEKQLSEKNKFSLNNSEKGLTEKNKFYQGFSEKNNFNQNDDIQNSRKNFTDFYNIEKNQLNENEENLKKNDNEEEKNYSLKNGFTDFRENLNFNEKNLILEEKSNSEDENSINDKKSDRNNNGYKKNILENENRVFNLKKLNKMRESEESVFKNMDFLKINNKKNIEDKRKKKIKENSSKKKKKSLKITEKNYFSENSENNFLHFFESKTKNFYYLDLQKNKKKIEKSIISKKKKTQQKLTLKKIELKIDFKIPLHHSSLINPEGFILLLGGLQNIDNKIIFKSETYILDFKNEKLIEISKMKNKRAGMSCIYSEKGIFIIGGILEDFKVSKKCELYDIEKNEFVDISDLKEPSMNSSLSLFRNSCEDIFIIKFGGKIDEEKLCDFVEIYDVEKDFWSVVLDSKFVFPSSGNSLQICENGLIFFGGVYQDFKEKSDSIFFIDFDPENGLFEISEDFFKLENKECFSCQQGIILDKKIFALQNYGKEDCSNGNIVVNKKRILCITEDECICLN